MRLLPIEFYKTLNLNIDNIKYERINPALLIPVLINPALLIPALNITSDNIEYIFKGSKTFALNIY